MMTGKARQVDDLDFFSDHEHIALDDCNGQRLAENRDDVTTLPPGGHGQERWEARKVG